MRDESAPAGSGGALDASTERVRRVRPALHPPSALELLGLTASDVAVYEQLVTAGSATLAEVQAGLAAASAPRSGMARLVASGLARRLPGSPIRYAANDPRSALSGALPAAPPERTAQGAEGLPDDVAAGLAELAVLASGAQRTLDDTPGLLVERIQGEFEARARLSHVLAAARSSVRLIARGAAGVRAAASYHRGVLLRGVGCQVLYPRPALADDAIIRDVEALVAAGQESRVLPTLPLDLALIDDRWGLLSVAAAPAAATPSVEGAAGEPSGLLLVHPSTLLEALSLLFDNLWRRALPVQLPTEATTGGVRGGSAAQSEQILAMMLSGATDEAMARRLGLSNRTLQRRIAELMDEMGVRSRFQLGIQAALRAGH